MKFGQLIEYNMKNIFLEKSYIKCGGDFFKVNNGNTKTICEIGDVVLVSLLLTSEQI